MYLEEILILAVIPYFVLILLLIFNSFIAIKLVIFYKPFLKHYKRFYPDNYIANLKYLIVNTL